MILARKVRLEPNNKQLSRLFQSAGRVNDLAHLLNRLNQEGATQELRKEALDLVSNIDPVELSMAEQKLIQDGMEPETLRHLCDVHMEVLSNELIK